MKKFKRIFLIVMDSFGAGHAKDGAAYGDDGADTMGHIAEKHDNWKIPNLTRLGLAIFFCPGYGNFAAGFYRVGKDAGTGGFSVAG